jgi:hypothetical protein
MKELNAKLEAAKQEAKNNEDDQKETNGKLSSFGNGYRL